MTTDPDGTLELVGDQSVLRFERFYENSVADVWDAITSPERLAQWWLPFDAEITIEMHPGGRYELRGTSEGAPTLELQVLEVAAPHRFVHTHIDPRSIITWQLDERDGGCALTLTQTLPDRDAAIEGKFIVGTHTSFDRLRALLAGTPIEWDWDAFAAYAQRYSGKGLA